MAKKFSLLLAAVAVLAFAVPSMASAAKTATLTEGGVKVAVGATVVGTGTDVTLTSNLLGPITCEKITLIGKVTKNNTGEVEGAGVPEKPGQTGCKNNANPVVVTSVTLKNLFAEEANNAKASFSATIDIGTGAAEIECTFTGTNVPAEYTAGTDTVNFLTATVIIGSPAKCGNAKLTASFTLETANGAQLILD